MRATPTANMRSAGACTRVPFGAIYTHDGSNGLWYASVYLFPGLGTGRIAVSNGAGPVGPGGQVVQAAIGALFELYPPER